MSPAGLSRRALLAAALSSAAVAAAVPVAVLDRPGLLRRILHRHLGPFEMANEQFARFVEDLEDRLALPSAIESDILYAIELLPGDPGSILPMRIEGRREQMERHLLTEFMLGTGLREEPRGRVLSYSEQTDISACGNPFAQLA